MLAWRWEAYVQGIFDRLLIYINSIADEHSNLYIGGNEVGVKWGISKLQVNKI
jgi:hypothetical protein